MSSNEVVTDIERPARERVEAFTDVPAAIVADVTVGPSAVDSAVNHIAGDPTLLGTAVTVRSPPGDNLMVHRALQLATAGDVLVVDAGGHTDSAVWGELMSTSAQAHGLGGTVVDGAVRDLRDIDELGYPVYARAVTPSGSRKAVPGSVNVPVVCGGVTVSPGDVIVGDAAGIAVVPRADIETVAEAAAAKLETEAELRERVADGEYLFTCWTSTNGTGNLTSKSGERIRGHAVGPATEARANDRLRVAEAVRRSYRDGSSSSTGWVTSRPNSVSICSVHDVPLATSVRSCSSANSASRSDPTSTLSS